MSTLNEIEEFFIRANSTDFISWFQEKSLLPREASCPSCFQVKKLESKLGWVENFCYRCYTSGCSNRYKRHSILFNTFLKGLVEAYENF
jgi:hypothetical protein